MTLNFSDENEARIRAAAIADGYRHVEQFVLDRLLNDLPPAAKRGKRVGGQWKGQVVIAEDFDELPQEF